MRDLQLIHDSECHPYYKPDLFRRKEDYNKWLNLEKDALATIIRNQEKKIKGDLPAYPNGIPLINKDKHTWYKILLVKLFRYDLKYFSVALFQYCFTYSIIFIKMYLQIYFSCKKQSGLTYRPQLHFICFNRAESVNCRINFGTREAIPKEPLSPTALRLLDEFGERYRIGFLFRRVCILEYLARFVKSRTLQSKILEQLEI